MIIMGEPDGDYFVVVEGDIRYLVCKGGSEWKLFLIKSLTDSDVYILRQVGCKTIWEMVRGEYSLVPIGKRRVRWVV